MVWNPRKDKKVLNVGGADFDEGVGRSWWLGTQVGELGEMERVDFRDQHGDRDPLADGDRPTVIMDGPPAYPGGGPPLSLTLPPPATNNDEEADMPDLLSSDDDDGDEDPPAPPHPLISARGNRGVPATRYDEIFEVAADFMNPPSMTVALEGVKVAEWFDAIEAELPIL